MDKEFSIQRIIARTDLLGQILIRKNLISNSQLDEALALQRQEGSGLLGDVLIKKGFISEELLAVALASQTDLCYCPVERYKITKEAMKLIPKDVALKYCCLPLEKIGGVLTIAMANPFDQDAIAAVESLTHYKIICMIGSKTQIEKSINLLYQI